MSKAKHWRPIDSPELKHSIEQCVREVAKKLLDPSLVRESAKAAEQKFNRPGPVWSDLDLATGYPGLCLLFSELDRLYPDENWDMTGHAHLLELQKAIQAQKIRSFSLWGGLSGIALGVRALSRGGTRYRGFISSLQDVFLRQYETSLNQSLLHLESGVRMNDYDVLEGFTGIGRYLLAYAEQPEIRKVLYDILAYLVRLSEDKIVDGYIVPGWHIPAAHQVLPQEKIDYPLGSFNCGVAHGIPGPLALLSLSLSAGVEIPGQRQAISRMAEWLLKWKQSDEYGPFWPPRIAWEEQHTGLTKSTWQREAWCYGSPSVARTLWLAGEALGESSWKQISLETFIALTQRPEQYWNLHAPTLCHGYAGLLQMTQRMYIDSGEEKLNVLREHLARRMLEAFDQNATFGFSEVIKTEHETAVLHNPGLLQGAAGAALALLGLCNTQEPEWDEVLLIT